MSATSDLVATQLSGLDVFNNFQIHCNGQRTETKSEVMKLLRQSYSSYHITEAEEKHVSLFEFARAGKAEYELDYEDGAFNNTRQWRAFGKGVEKKEHPGILHDDFRFARFQYTWNSCRFIIYYVVWQDTFKSAEKMFYILSPRENSTIEGGHCAETDALLLAAGKWTSQLHEEIFIFDNGYWEKSKDLWNSVCGSSWDDVILDPDMKKNLIDDVQGFFNNQLVYKKFSVPWKRGIILHGVPGNGKTVSIKALMASLYSRAEPIPSLYVKSLTTACQTEQFAIRQIFTMARSQAPCLLIFEDLDSLVGDNIRSYFLNEVDGLESNDGILMIGSTNHLDKLDPAIAKRPSRFDRKYHFKLPAEEERRLYALYWRNKLLSNNTIDFPETLASVIAQLTEGFSFAYLKELFVMALLSLVRGFNGDDFEIVDKEEAQSAEEDDDGNTVGKAGSNQAGSNKQDDAEKEGKVCTCATKCATCHLPLPSSSNDNDKSDGKPTEKEKEIEKRKTKMTMPRVQVPDELAENLLLKVIKHHIRVLHADMDNTKEEDKPSGKNSVSGEKKYLKVKYRQVQGMRMARAC